MLNLDPALETIVRDGLAILANISERQGMHLCACLRCREAVYALEGGDGCRLMDCVPESDADAFGLEEHRCIRPLSARQCHSHEVSL